MKIIFRNLDVWLKFGCKYSLIYLIKYDIIHKRDRLSGGIKSRYELSKSIGKYFNIAISLSFT